MAASLGASVTALQDDFADPALVRRLKGHEGRWVAVKRGRVVASEETADEAYDAVGRQGIEEAVVFKVPAKPSRITLL